jgi:hypothetical protein
MAIIYMAIKSMAENNNSLHLTQFFRFLLEFWN